MQSDNTKGTGLTAPATISKIYDLNGAVVGDPQDKLWYFATARTKAARA